MTPEKQRIAIAEACGWRRAGNYWLPPEGRPQFNVLRDKNGCPDYLSDLNAMHEAEKVLNDEQRTMYLDGLEKLCFIPRNGISYEDYVQGIGWNHRSEHVTATAAQRAEAFLRTIGKWEES